MSAKKVKVEEPEQVGTARIFRIKVGSPLDRAMRYWDEHPEMTRPQVKKAVGVGPMDVQAAQALSKYSDNYSIGHYVEVMPQNIVHVEHAKVGDGTGIAPLATIDEFRWPHTPMVEDELKWFKKPSWYARMRTMVGLGKHIALSGPPGIGKSTAVRALAAEMGRPLVHVSADVGLRRRDLTGSVELMNGSTQFVVAEYAAAAIYGWWAKVDEVNAAEADALLFMNSQLEEPRRVNFHGRAYPVHPDFRCFVTYNPGLIGTKPLPQSFVDRFFPIKQEFPSVSQLTSILKVHGGADIAPEALYTIVKFGVEAWASHKKGNMRYQITPRRLQDAIDLVKCGEKPLDALRESVMNIVDNPAEVSVLEMVLNSLDKFDPRESMEVTDGS